MGSSNGGEGTGRGKRGCTQTEQGLQCPGQTFGAAGVLPQEGSQGRAFLFPARLGPMCSPVPLPGPRAGSEPECPGAPAYPWPPGQPPPGHQEPGQRKPQPGLPKPGRKNWGPWSGNRGLLGLQSRRDSWRCPCLCTHEQLRPREGTCGDHAAAQPGGPTAWTVTPGVPSSGRGVTTRPQPCELQEGSARSFVGRRPLSVRGEHRGAESPGWRAGRLVERVPPPGSSPPYRSLRTEESGENRLQSASFPKGQSSVPSTRAPLPWGLRRGRRDLASSAPSRRPRRSPRGPGPRRRRSTRAGDAAPGLRADEEGSRVLGQAARSGKLSGRGTAGTNRATLLLVLLLTAPSPFAPLPRIQAKPTSEAPAGKKPLVETDQNQRGPVQAEAPGQGPCAARPPAFPRPERLGQTSRLTTRSFISTLLPRYVPIQSGAHVLPSASPFQASEPGLQVSLSVRMRRLPRDLQAGDGPKCRTNLWIQSPAMSAVTGPARPGGPGGRSRDLGRWSARAASGPVAGTPGPGRAARSARGGWLRLLALERPLAHVAFEKSKLRFRAGSPAWPSKVRAPSPASAPEQGARASAGQSPGLGRAGAPADLAPQPSGPASLGSAPARLPHSAAPPSAPGPPNLAAGDDAEFRKLLQKNKIPTSTLLD